MKRLNRILSTVAVATVILASASQANLSFFSAVTGVEKAYATATTTIKASKYVESSGKWVGHKNVGADERIYFRIEIINTGNNVAKNLVVQDYIGEKFDLATYTLGYVTDGTLSLDRASRKLHWKIPQVVVAPRAAVIEFSLKLHPYVPNNATVKNCLKVTERDDLVTAVHNVQPCVTVTKKAGSTGGGGGDPSATADLSITKSTKKNVVQQGESFVYVLQVKNHGKAQAQDVVVTDHIPDRLTDISFGNNSDSVCSLHGKTVTCRYPKLGVGGVRNIHIRARAPVTGSCGDVIENTASVKSSTKDSSPNNNSNSAAVRVACVETDISIKKVAPKSIKNDASAIFTYTLTVKNHTNVPAEDVVISDPVPADLRVIESSLPSNPKMKCRLEGNNKVVCHLGQLGKNATRNFSFKVSAAAQCSYCGQTVTNTAEVTTSTRENNLHNNRSSASTKFLCTPQITDLHLSKTAPKQVNNDNDVRFTYVLTVKNTTKVPAANVVVTDTVPNGLRIIQSSLKKGCSAHGQVVTCNLGTVKNAEVVRFDVEASAQCEHCRQTVKNTAKVTTTTKEPNQNNNTASALTKFNCTPQVVDLELSKTGPKDVQGGKKAKITYTLTVKNHSKTVVAQDVRIIDDIPPSLRIVKKLLPKGCDNDGQKITCNLGSLGKYQSKTVKLTVQDYAVCSHCGQTVKNTARVTTSTEDSYHGNNAASFVTTFH